MPDDDQNQPTDTDAADVTGAAPADDQSAPVDEQPAEPTSTGGQTAQGGRDQYGRQMFTVKCSNCGKDAQVPFQPSGGRPVYCRDCYMQMRNQRGGGSRR